MIAPIKDHWPEYLIEACCLATFMVSANLFTAAIFHPGFGLASRHLPPLALRALMGLAMGGTAIAIVFSPWGKRSGAHMNPATTLTFWRLGKVASGDAAFYVLAQFVGGIAGTIVAELLLGDVIRHPAVDWARTVPGPAGTWVALAAEVAITFVLMLTVLAVSNSKRLARWTGLFAGALVALYITFESPLSGMSMNPARTLGSAVPAMTFTALWIYFVAPLAGMLLAAETFVRAGRLRVVHCAKYHHENDQRCIFNCRYAELGS